MLSFVPPLWCFDSDDAACRKGGSLADEPPNDNANTGSNSCEQITDEPPLNSVASLVARSHAWLIEVGAP